MSEEIVINDILYIDKKYISNQYERIENVSPHIKITKTENLSSPSWHKDILDEREKTIETGKEAFIDWNEAKEQIEDEIS